MLKSFRSFYFCLMIAVAVMASFIAIPSSQAHEKAPRYKYSLSNDEPASDVKPFEAGEIQFIEPDSVPDLVPGMDYATRQSTTTLAEGFEGGTKTSYTTGSVTLGTGSWTLNNTLIGDSSTDRKVGTKSARVRNLGKVTMNFNVTGAGTVTVKHAKFGTDANANWELWYSTTSGSSWTKAGTTVTTSSTTLQTASFVINTTSTVRFEIRKTTGNNDSSRLNFDDFTISSNTTPPPPSGCTTTAITLPATINGTIATTDCLLSDGSYADKFSFTGSANQSVTITHDGTGFDAYLIVEGPNSYRQEDDDSAGNTDSKLVLTLPTAGTYTITATTYDPNKTGSYTLTVTTGTTPPPPPPPTSSSRHLALGNPSGATADVNNFTNYLMEKTQYVLSYHRDKRTANWASWNLTIADRGSAPRQDDFREDPTLPAGWYRVQSAAFGTVNGTSYDRGHMCPSADRTDTVQNNSATFLMTNMMVQSSDNNQGPWNNLESYTRDQLLNGTNEVYIICGGAGSKGTHPTNGMNIPARTWKVIVILPAGDNDASRVTTATRVIAVNMPNDAGIRTVDWKTYRVSVDSIEALTGFDFLSNVPASIQSTIESRVDNQ
ncbi:MAG TPA: DNA/RNA non-specific endonuclease [Acidobacteriota bacterium]|nr:DNA/RNA non-specific endonuclease [Acidobacteriota bacterium]